MKGNVQTELDSAHRPLVSVIIPAYNAAATIRSTVDSVLSQAFRDLELIVVDDGSTDDTREIAQATGDGRARVLRVPHRGIAASRNRGFAVARGVYVAFLDSDDVWMPEKVGDGLERFASHARAGVVYSWTDYIDARGASLYPGRHHSHEGQVYREMLLGDFLESGSNALLRREVAQALGGFDEQVPQGSEDWEYFIRASRLAEFACVRKPQVLYRVTSRSKSASIEEMRNGLVWMIARAFAQAPPSLAGLQTRSLAGIHFHLAQRAIDAAEGPGRAALSLRLLARALWLQPSLAVESPIALATAAVKAAAAGMVPASVLKRLLAIRRGRRALAAAARQADD